jgi:hypothetical protein
MKTIKITSFLIMLLCANSLMAQLKVKVNLDGCWETKWSNCGPALDGAKLTFKKDLTNNSQYTGAWGGGVDSNGYSHSGFMIGKLNGNTLYGTWYEIIYKDNSTCPNFSYQGKFWFKFNGDKFDGTWTDTNGPSKDCKKVMTWVGNRIIQ